ncbi:TetR/AcrR family transcriptional regulator [Mycobacterium sp. E2479]|uniref:TetR/AcrR family transcriptional regulator n=1 Tax=Mycobacterium sp. E2479 TaxID=1834134 RepID=UPI0007FF2F2D|nr:TetR/AcrR family transcriptional regulator [Mycobacterium sp. E2479]OBH63405.1 TetR family transcriptional regulator [Mycobacterium sp. E2479]
MSQPRRGRPRSAAVHEAILDATRTLLIEVGYSGVSMDKVAANAGVGTQTVYRRWPSKAPLVAEAVMQAYAQADFTLPDTGDTVEDLRTWMHESAALSAAPENIALVRALAAAAAEDLRDRDTLYQQLTSRFHAAVTQRLHTGISLGQIRADADIEAAADALIGATLYRMLSVTSTVGEAMGRYDGLIDTLMGGLSTS